MDSHDEIKKAVRQKYGQIAKNQHSAETPLASSCCGGSGCGTPAVVDMSLQYGEAEGYQPLREWIAAEKARG